MKQAKRKKLEAAGWKFGSAANLLALTPAEEAYVKIKLSLARELQKERKAKHLTQKALATELETSQPRVAMMERGDPSVSLDLIVRALLSLGVKPRKLAALL
jgi:predicted XRE-type DNA-binding protein